VRCFIDYTEFLLSEIVEKKHPGLRPVLILSHEVLNERSGFVIAVAITSKSQKAGFPLILQLNSANFPKTSWTKISQIRTLSTKRLRKKHL
jgi:mRNA interferase MazF